MNTSGIQLTDVSFSYGERDVLTGVNLTVEPGAFLPFVGPNGAGKTTLLRLILGLLTPTRGRISTPFRQVPAGYVPQVKAIDPLFPLSVRDIVEMGLFKSLGYWRKPGPDQTMRVDQTLDRLALAGHQHKTFGELSGGMKQKTLLARALVTGADVFVMDEPTSELDEQSEKEFLDHLVSLQRREGKTVLIAHHGLDQAAAMAERVCVVDHGRVRLGPAAGFKTAGSPS